MRQLLSILLIVTCFLLLVCRLTGEGVIHENAHGSAVSEWSYNRQNSSSQNNGESSRRYTNLCFFHEIAGSAIALDNPCKWLAAFICILWGLNPSVIHFIKRYSYRCLYCHPGRYYVFALRKIVI